MGPSMPALLTPTDVLARGGLRSMRHEAAATHPVERLERSSAVTEWENKLHHVERVYGPGQAMRMRMERAMLAQFQRAPGLPSSFVGLDTLLGRDVKIGFEDVLDLPCNRPDMPRETVHEVLERKLGMA
jgi:proteasome maturation protein